MIVYCIEHIGLKITVQRTDGSMSRVFKLQKFLLHIVNALSTKIVTVTVDCYIFAKSI